MPCTSRGHIQDESNFFLCTFIYHAAYYEVLNQDFGKLCVTLFTVFIPDIKVVIIITKVLSE
jgi:hypothetical protein